MKIKHILAAVCVVGLLAIGGCGGEEEAESTSGGTTAEPAGGGGGGGSCSRIADCCRAYVSAMGASVPASTCDAYNNVAGMQDSVCDQSMAGYRSGLTAMQKEVPAACN